MYFYFKLIYIKFILHISTHIYNYTNYLSLVRDFLVSADDRSTSLVM